MALGIQTNNKYKQTFRTIHIYLTTKYKQAECQICSDLKNMHTTVMWWW